MGWPPPIAWHVARAAVGQTPVTSPARQRSSRRLRQSLRHAGGEEATERRPPSTARVRIMSHPLREGKAERPDGRIGAIRGVSTSLRDSAILTTAATSRVVSAVRSTWPGAHEDDGGPRGHQCRTDAGDDDTIRSCAQRPSVPAPTLIRRPGSSAPAWGTRTSVRQPQRGDGWLSCPGPVGRSDRTVHWETFGERVRGDKCGCAVA
jgi:hypothetical protein